MRLTLRRRRMAPEDTYEEQLPSWAHALSAASNGHDADLAAIADDAVTSEPGEHEEADLSFAGPAPVPASHEPRDAPEPAAADAAAEHPAPADQLPTPESQSPAPGRLEHQRLRLMARQTGRQLEAASADARVLETRLAAAEAQLQATIERSMIAERQAVAERVRADAADAESTRLRAERDALSESVDAATQSRAAGRRIEAELAQSTASAEQLRLLLGERDDQLTQIADDRDELREERDRVYLRLHELERELDEARARQSPLEFGNLAARLAQRMREEEGELESVLEQRREEAASDAAQILAEADRRAEAMHARAIASVEHAIADRRRDLEHTERTLAGARDRFEAQLAEFERRAAGARAGVAEASERLYAEIESASRAEIGALQAQLARLRQDIVEHEARRDLLAGEAEEAQRRLEQAIGTITVLDPPPVERPAERPLSIHFAGLSETNAPGPEDSSSPAAQSDVPGDASPTSPWSARPPSPAASADVELTDDAALSTLAHLRETRATRLEPDVEKSNGAGSEVHSGPRTFSD